MACLSHDTATRYEFNGSIRKENRESCKVLWTFMGTETPWPSSHDNYVEMPWRLNPACAAPCSRFCTSRSKGPQQHISFSCTRATCLSHGRAARGFNRIYPREDGKSWQVLWTCMAVKTCMAAKANAQELRNSNIVLGRNLHPISM